MKYIIQGQNINKIYKIVSNKNDDGSFTSKPEMRLDSQDITYENIIEFETDTISYNCNNEGIWTLIGCNKKLNISETETVEIKKEIFRADIVTTFLVSDKILSNTNNKNDISEEYNVLMSEYCKYICEKYPNVKRHIEIYNITLPVEEIDDIVSEVENKNKLCSIGTINIKDCGITFSDGSVFDYSGIAMLNK